MIATALSIPPGFYLVFGSLILMIIRHVTLSKIFALITTIWAIAHIYFLYNTVTPDITWYIAGFILKPLTIHPYSLLFASAFSIVLLFGTCFAMQHFKQSELSITFFYAGMGINVLFVGDLISFLLFWEFMTIGGTILIWSRATEQSFTAGLRYGLVHLFGGVLLVCSTALLIDIQHSTAIPTLTLNMENWSDPDYWTYPSTIASILFLAGLCVNAAVPPLSAWLPDSYPSASPEASIFLSAYTTKSAILLLMIIFAQNDILIYLGAFMIIYGSLYSLIEDEVRRVLSYSLIQQVGIMLILIGIGTPLALHITAIHAFSHIIYKALLFMGAAALIHNFKEESCLKMGGTIKQLPFVSIALLVGTFTASGMPLTLAFISKSLMGNVITNMSGWLESILVFSAIMGFLHTGIKLSWFMVLRPSKHHQTLTAGKWIHVAMLGIAMFCIIPGIAPELLFKLLPSNHIAFPPIYQTHSIGHQLTYGLIAVIFFVLTLPTYQWMRRVPWDFDWIYRTLCYELILILWRVPYGLMHFLIKPTIPHLKLWYGSMIRTQERISATITWPLSWQLMILLTVFAVFLVVFFH